MALVERDAISIAIVGDPIMGLIDLAERGRGAWSLQDGAGRRLTTSAQSRTIVVDDGKSKGLRRTQAARFIAAAIRADRWDFRSLGTTLAAPYLAAGRIAAYVVFWVSALHSGAGSLLIREAGGTCRTSMVSRGPSDQIRSSPPPTPTSTRSCSTCSARETQISELHAADVAAEDVRRVPGGLVAADRVAALLKTLQ